MLRRSLTPLLKCGKSSDDRQYIIIGGSVVSTYETVDKYLTCAAMQGHEPNCEPQILSFEGIRIGDARHIKLQGCFSRQHLDFHLIPRRRNESKMSNHILLPLFAAYVFNSCVRMPHKPSFHVGNNPNDEPMPCPLADSLLSLNDDVDD
jgi:hypothetical protein